MHWSTPGGTISRTMEDFGIHHWGEFTIYFGGFAIPVVYGCVLAYLGVRLTIQTGNDDDADLQGRRIGIFLSSIGIITVIGLFFRVNFANTVIHTINNKHILKFDNCSANQKTVALLSTIEKDILNYYATLFQCNKKKTMLLGDYLSNGSIKVYLKNKVKNDTNYIIKISGVWENENEIGITYKLLEAETLG